MKKYKEIEFSAGNTIDSAIKELMRFKKTGELVFGSFNGHKLYSDKDDIESAYKKIMGITKYEFDKRVQKEHLKYESEEKKHKEAIPELTKKWINEGKNILDEKYLELWNKIVPIRLGDLYHGMELDACLKIVAKLNKGCKLSVARKIIENQGHSGMSYGLVCTMVRAFCDRGDEFVNYVK